MTSNHKPAEPAKAGKEPAAGKPAPMVIKAEEHKAAEAWMKERLVDVYNG